MINAFQKQKQSKPSQYRKITWSSCSRQLFNCLTKILWKKCMKKQVHKDYPQATSSICNLKLKLALAVENSLYGPRAFVLTDWMLIKSLRRELGCLWCLIYSTIEKGTPPKKIIGGPLYSPTMEKGWKRNMLLKPSQSWDYRLRILVLLRDKYQRSSPESACYNMLQKFQVSRDVPTAPMVCEPWGWEGWR